MAERFFMREDLKKAMVQTEDEDGVLTEFGMKVANEYATAWQSGRRDTILEQAHPELVGLFYDIRNDRSLAAEHAIPLGKSSTFYMGVDPAHGEDFAVGTVIERQEDGMMNVRYTIPLEKAQPKVIKIGPKGGKIIGYRGKTPIYLTEGSDSGGGGASRKDEGKKPSPGEKESSVELPQDPWRYFKKHPEAKMIPIDKLKPMRAREGGIESAGKYMRAAYDGTMDKRDPVAIKPNKDGTYTLLSGNSTFAQAQKNGWTEMPGVVDEKLSEAINALEHAIAEGKVKGSVNEHVTIAKHFIKDQKKHFDAEVAALKEMAPSNARVEARMKTLDSALGKIVRKPDEYSKVSDLHDITGTRIVCQSVSDVYATLEKLKAKYEIVDLDDRIEKPMPPHNYRSIHLIFKGQGGFPKEMQLRTQSMGEMADWTHDIYKPQTDEQRRLVAEKGRELDSLAKVANDHTFSRDRGDKPPDPPKPPCPTYVQHAFGCPPV